MAESLLPREEPAGAVDAGPVETVRTDELVAGDVAYRGNARSWLLVTYAHWPNDGTGEMVVTFAGWELPMRFDADAMWTRQVAQ